MADAARCLRDGSEISTENDQKIFRSLNLLAVTSKRCGITGNGKVQAKLTRATKGQETAFE
jgi:hypothetical protein